MIPYKIEMQIERPPDVAKRRWKEYMRAAHADQAEQWHQEYLPRHFTLQAKFAYKHRRRSPKYLERKRKMGLRGKARLGGRVDNVLTGQLMDLMLGFASIRAFPTRSTLVMQGPRYITMRPRPGNLDKAAELTRVIPSEERVLSETMERTVAKKLDEFRQPQRIKV